jgi:hypothetical protein
MSIVPAVTVIADVISVLPRQRIAQKSLTLFSVKPA